MKDSKDRIVNVLEPVRIGSLENMNERPFSFDGISIRQKDSLALLAGQREIMHDEILGWIQPRTRISDDAEGLTQEKLMEENNPLGWECTLGHGDKKLTLTGYERKDTKKRIFVITDASGKIRGEIFSFQLM